MDIWNILRIMKQKQKSFPFFPPLSTVFTQKCTITHCCCRWLMTGTVRWKITLHSTQWGDTALFVYAPLAWLSLDKGKKLKIPGGKTPPKKQHKIRQPEFLSVCMPLLLNCDKYLDLNNDYWPPCKKTPVSNVYWKSVARLPLNTRLLGFAACLPPSHRGKKIIDCMEIKHIQ